jgi:flagellar hook protein FlgE
MLSGFTSVSALRAQSLAIDVAANNLANVNTPGFKRSSTRLQETRPSPNGTGQNVGTGILVGSTPQQFSQGALQITGVSSDLAIDGAGFFAIQDDNGGTFYTRSGSFVQDAQGFLRTPTGGYLLGTGGRIQVPTGSASYSIDRDGTITSFDSSGNSSSVGTVSLTSFPNENGLNPVGNGLFSPTDAAGSPSTANPGADGRGSIQSGALEMSNVDIAEEMVDMIIAQRSFEANAHVVTTTDEMLQTITNIRR